MNKKRTISMWILYAINAIFASIWVAGGLDYYFSGWSASKIAVAISDFYNKIGFDFYLSLSILCGAIMLVCTIAIIIIGKRYVFPGEGILLLIIPYIVCIFMFFMCGLDRNEFAYVAYNGVMFADMLILVISQIYLVIKLAKATKQLKA